jgi:hypothetical protein
LADGDRRSAIGGVGMIRQGSHSRRYSRLGLGAGMILMSLGILMSDSLREARTINLKVVADEELKCGCESWCFYLKTLIRAVSKDFEERFGIRFSVKKVGGWMSDNSRQTSYDLLNDLRSGIDKEKCDVVVGFTAQEPVETAFSGVTSYTMGYVLIRSGPSKAWIRNTLKHELGHLFGAVDIAESSSVMGTQQRWQANRFDEFSSALIDQNRDRTFLQGCFPLSGPSLDRVIEMCSDRHEKMPHESGVTELLALLYLEKKDWDALKRIGLEAVSSAPGSVEAHNLMGLAYFNQEEYGEAVQEFQKVLQLEPCHPDAYRNLAVSYLRSGRIDEARESCEKALAILPGSIPALGIKRELQALQGQFNPSRFSSLLANPKTENPKPGKKVPKKKQE